MKKFFLMVAFTFTATTVFAHHDETKKGGADQKAQKEQKVQDEQKAQKEQESDSEAFHCSVERSNGKVVECYLCNCRKLAVAVIEAEKVQ